MKRLHVNVGVSNLDRSVAFYSRLFDAAPTVLKPDYARWMLDDPRVNFAISARGRAGVSARGRAGVDHVGIQCADDAEFAGLRDRLAAADLELLEQADATCCYARSGKAWLRDPDGLAWETFVTWAEAAEFGDDAAPAAAGESRARVCCSGASARTCC